MAEWLDSVPRILLFYMGTKRKFQGGHGYPRKTISLAHAVNAGLSAVKTASDIYKNVKSMYQQPESAEQDVGYGTHSVRQIYRTKTKTKLSKKARLRRKRVIGKRRWRTKVFKRRVHAVVDKKYGLDCFMQQRWDFQQNIVNQQTVAVFSCGTSSWGSHATPTALNTGERNNDLMQVLRTVKESTSGERRLKNRILLKNMVWDLTITNTDTNLGADVDVYELVCKRNVPNMVYNCGLASPWIHAPTWGSWKAILDSANDEPWQLDQNAVGAKYAQMVSSTVGWTPFHHQLLTKYFTIKKADRIHLTAGGADHINLQRKYKIRKMIGEPVCDRWAAMKGITRLFIVCWRTPATSNGTTDTYVSQSSTANKGLVFTEQKHLYYKALDDTYAAHAGDGEDALMVRRNTFLVAGATGDEEDSVDVVAVNRS